MHVRCTVFSSLVLFCVSTLPLAARDLNCCLIIYIFLVFKLLLVLVF